jgi:hypothetical protein
MALAQATTQHGNIPAPLDPQEEHDRRAERHANHRRVACIAGDDYGSSQVGHSPVTREELRALEETVGWSHEDEAALRRASEVLRDQAEALVDDWRGVIAQQPHLVKWFHGPDGKPDDHYRASVKKRFVQWVIDACTRPHDQAWLGYQEEIGLRHAPAKKHRTDGTQTPHHVPLRYVRTR